MKKDLTDLKKRRKRCDFIQIYKIEHGPKKVNWCDVKKMLRPEQNIKRRRHPFQLSPERNRGNEP